MPNACTPARIVEIALRYRSGPGSKRYRMYDVVCPETWSKADFLAYCRACHPDETVNITNWGEVYMDQESWKPKLWIVGELNPGA